MIRVYGVIQGQGSLVRVTSGACSALRELGLLSGLVPVDAYDEDLAASYAGCEASVGVLLAPTTHAWMMKAIGKHARRLVLLPPNSTWVPERLLDELRRTATGIVVPSEWAAGIMKGYGTEYGLPVSVWEHGVDAAFHPDLRAHDLRRTEYANREFKVLHLSSTDRQRKGSRELIEAWALAIRRNDLGAHPKLHMCVDDPAGQLRGVLDRAAAGSSRVRASVDFLRSRMEYGPAEARAAYSDHHLVAQPSRGEAFGMCPLEARACGVPIVATDCTGHSAHIKRGEPGVVVVPTGPLGPIDDGPGALAPTLNATDICDALCEAYAGWADLDDAALAHADTLRSWLSWRAVTERWLTRERVLSDWPKVGS